MYDNELAEFKKWLEQRQRYFDEVNLTPSDIANIAKQDGFSDALLSQWQQRKRWESMDRAS